VHQQKSHSVGYDFFVYVVWFEFLCNEEAVEP